jgi:hypothetical protein
MTKEEKIQEYRSKQLIDELSKMPPMVIATAYLHAINYTLYGEDVTEKWLTATQNASALEKAYQKGYYDAMERVKPPAQPEQRWIACDKGEPDEDMECWVTVKTTDALYRGNFTKRFGKGFVTSCGFMWWNTALAWMPIYEPEPYRTEGDDNHEG